MSVIHALCPLSAKGTPTSSFSSHFHRRQEEALPSPPHSPPSNSQQTAYNLPSIISQSAQEFCKSINPNSFMPASVHMVLNAASSDLMTQRIVTIDAANSQYCRVPYCTKVLDPLFHTSAVRKPIVDQQKQWFEYVRLNEKFADAIIEQYQSEQDIIWIHDYQLLMVPAIVRRKFPRANIAISIYGQFPCVEQVRNAAGGRQILQSLVASNVIGFLTTDDIKHFYTSCSSADPSFSPSPSCLPICTILPAVSSLTTTPPSSLAQARTRSLRNMFDSKRIVFCQDTSAPGVYQTLAAFEYLLSTQPQLRDEIVFIHVCPLSVVPERLDSVPDVVRQINQIYRSQDSVPVHFYHQDLDCDEYDALLMSADVALIMGLHPSAAVAAQAFVARHKNVGAPLIVSEGSPLADQVKTVQQSDHAGVAFAIHQALSMGKPQKSLYQKISQQLDPTRLSESFMKRLAGQLGKTRLLDTAALVETYKTSRRRLLLFDYDGTLTPIVANPEDARPTPKLLRYLQALCHDPSNTVWVISGRDQKTLEAWLGGVEGLGLSAEHGSFMKLPGSGSWIDMLAEADMAWKNTALEIFQKYAQQTPGTVVEQKKSSITWHYRNAHDAEFALLQCEKCYSELRAIFGADILRGKMNLEVRSLLVNKGEVVKRIQSQVGPDFILCAGDDRTDEDMFRALQGHPAYCVLIGPQDKQTVAGWCVETSEQFVSCLGAMTTHKSSF